MGVRAVPTMNRRGFPGTVNDALKGVIGRLRREGQEGQSARFLSKFDDQMLDDIGLTREQARELDRKTDHGRCGRQGERGAIRSRVD